MDPAPQHKPAPTSGPSNEVNAQFARSGGARGASPKGLGKHLENALTHAAPFAGSATVMGTSAALSVLTMPPINKAAMRSVVALPKFTGALSAMKAAGGAMTAASSLLKGIPVIGALLPKI